MASDLQRLMGCLVVYEDAEKKIPLSPISLGTICLPKS